MFDEFKGLPTLEEGEAEIEKALFKELELHQIGIKNTYFLISLIFNASCKRFRTIAIRTSRGYSGQAAIIASSLYETALMVAYVGKNEDAAAKWVDHENPTHMFIKIKDLTTEAVRRTSSAEMSEDEISKEADASYEIYRTLCMMKHGNPLFQKNHSFIIEGNNVIASPGPIISEQSVRVSWYVISFRSIASWYVIIDIVCKTNRQEAVSGQAAYSGGSGVPMERCRPYMRYSSAGLAAPQSAITDQ